MCAPPRPRERREVAGGEEEKRDEEEKQQDKEKGPTPNGKGLRLENVYAREERHDWDGE